MIEGFIFLFFIEPYQCTGKFADDFTNLCKQFQVSYIPPVIQRGKRPSTPTITDVKTEKSRSKKVTTTQSTNNDSQSVTQSDIYLPANSHVQKQPSISNIYEQDELKDYGTFLNLPINNHQFIN